MSSDTMLPSGFADLERFVEHWAKPTVNERVDARCRSSMAEITEFYDALIVRAGDILDYLDQFPLHDMPEDAGRLTQLLLALVQASVAVEIQGQPLPPKTDYPFRVELVGGVAPFGI
jgi:hypothetical protein